MSKGWANADFYGGLKFKPRMLYWATSRKRDREKIDGRNVWKKLLRTSQALGRPVGTCFIMRRGSQ